MSLWCGHLSENLRHESLSDAADLIVRDQITLPYDSCEMCRALKPEVREALERLKVAKLAAESLIARLIGENVAVADRARHEYKQAYRYDTYGAYQDALETQVRQQLPSDRHNDPRFWRIVDLLSPLSGIDDKTLLTEHLTKWAPTLPAAKLKLELLHAAK